MAILYFDLGSPYAYLAVARMRSVFGGAVELRPVLLGAMFRWRGWGSWSAGPDREVNMADVEARAARYGLPPLLWPPDWPVNTLIPMRATIWAERLGAIEPFVRSVYAREFARGIDISDLDVLRACAEEAGLDGAALPAAIAEPTIKEALKDATQVAWDAGVRGVPSVRVGDAVFYGDDHLEDAAAAAGPD